MKMKTKPLLSSLLLGTVVATGALLFSGCTSADTEAARAAIRAQPIRLQVVVIVPASMNMIRDDDAAEAFGQTVRTSLHENGFKGRIHLIDDGQQPAAGIPVLEVNLTEWRVDPLGNVTCTFGATLRTPQGTKGLGLFTGGSLMTWLRRDWIARSDSFQDAAHDAVSNLADKIQQTGLLPKVPPSGNTI
jgi:hypothetical protein